MTRLSVNINKIATIRNARGGNTPNLLEAAINCERFGAEGITVHPRPDERHIRYSDVRELSPIIKTEFNIEGYPGENFLKLIEEVKPNQVTLVPDAPDAITSNSGWDTKKNLLFLKDIILRLKTTGCRTSIFVNTDFQNIEYAKECGTDRIELYTEPYADNFPINPKSAIEKFYKAAEYAHELGIGINAGHDLNLDNLKFFNTSIPWLDEVSIGHALISDALYYGLENTIQMYQNRIR